MVISSSRLSSRRGKVRPCPSHREEGKARRVKGWCRAPGWDNPWVEFPHDPGGPPLHRAWTLPLGVYSAPETGASKLGPDLIHNICTADSTCQLGPTAWPGDVRPQPDSLTWQPSPQRQVQPAQLYPPGPDYPTSSYSHRPCPPPLSDHFVSG